MQFDENVVHEIPNAVPPAVPRNPRFDRQITGCHIDDNHDDRRLPAGGAGHSGHDDFVDIERPRRTANPIEQPATFLRVHSEDPAEGTLLPFSGHHPEPLLGVDDDAIASGARNGLRAHHVIVRSFRPHDHAIASRVMRLRVGSSRKREHRQKGETDRGHPFGFARHL